MVDWFYLAANTLWILGCAIALAVLSYTSWEASSNKEKLTTRLKRPAVQAALNLAGLLIVFGVALIEDTPLSRSLYALLGLLFLALLIISLRAMRKVAPPGSR